LEPFQDEDDYWMPGLVKHTCPGLEEIRAERRQRLAQRSEEKEEERWLTICGHAGLSERRRGMTFENFDSSRQPDAYEEAEHFFTMPQTIVFCGPVGVGKTHLASAILHRWLRIGFENEINQPNWGKGLVGGRGYFTTLPKLLSRIKATFKDNVLETEDQIIRRCVNFPLLVLDDVGKEKQSEYSQQILFSIIDGRYVHSRPLIMTSNAVGPEFGKVVGQAVYSRLCEMGTIINMQASGDFRLRR
jgi:DNA replication protein DnaC